MPWDRELAQLEKTIGQLAAGYDAFLYGTAPRPPVESRRQVDTTLRRLDALEPETAADGFRLSTIQTRYTALCERWDRLQAEKEAGKRPGVYARFTREGVRQPEAVRPAPPSVQPEPPSSPESTPNGGATASVEPPGQAPIARPGGESAFVL
jgi:hypothetical protein